MPLQPTVTQIRFNNIAACLPAAVDTLDMISESLDTPFLPVISRTIRSLLTAAESMKKNKDDCTQMLEQIHVLLNGIIRLHLTSETGGELSPSMFEHLGRFTETLYKIHTFVEAQGQTSRIRQFFRQGEMSTLLKDCLAGLDQALEVFKIQNIQVLSDVSDMQQYAQQTHQEVLDLISRLSDRGNSDRGSSITSSSSNSLSLWPSEPKIFHGRESEVSAIVKHFGEGVPNIAILGAGGMGKTSLARAVLHHPDISARYKQYRFFVACDQASTSVDLAALIGAHIGLKPDKDLTRPIIRYFSGSPPSLLILDNLETLWEPTRSRTEVEKFLALLADVEDLALIITMRGAERPANVQWTHPFLEPLKPLTLDAARKTFIDIADDDHSDEDIEKILQLADNMPLAIDLIAHLVNCEDVSSLLNRWETERTSLLSEGYDKGSNLDLSISLSLASPRVMSLPQAQDLLSLLSILPDGLSDIELVQSRLPIKNILACKAALLRTALAYSNDQKRLKILVPIREYMHQRHPPPGHLVQAVLQHFHQLLNIHEAYHGTISSAGIVARLKSNFANIQSILGNSLTQDNHDLVNTIYCICHFHRFSMLAGHGQSQLMHHIRDILPHPRDHRLEVYFITWFFSGYLYHSIPDADFLVTQALESFAHFEDPELKCELHHDCLIKY
ncbi:P-loop containing nucleoside triphosphate hydrolase protein, partial [Mycena latifolia]